MSGPAATDFTVFGMYVDRKRILLGMGEADVARECDVTVDDVRLAIAGRRIGRAEFYSLCEWLGREPSFFAIAPNGESLEAAR